LSAIAHNAPARRIVTSLLALLVVIMTLPGPVNWVCMLKSGGVQCCCIRIDVGDDGDGPTNCCRKDVARAPLGDVERGDPGAGGNDGGDPCDCGDEEQEPWSVDPKDGGDAPVVAVAPIAATDFDWAEAAPRSVGADHETQQRCTGPPLYVLFEVFLI
jgi:hypothetical protein